MKHADSCEGPPGSSWQCTRHCHSNDTCRYGLLTLLAFFMRGAAGACLDALTGAVAAGCIASATDGGWEAVMRLSKVTTLSHSAVS